MTEEEMLKRIKNFKRKGKSKRALKDKERLFLDKKESDSFDDAINKSPNTDKMLWFTPDDGRTVIYCKNEKHLAKCREKYNYLCTRKHSISKKWEDKGDISS